jgi:2-phosphoglycerate kinase
MECTKIIIKTRLIRGAINAPLFAVQKIYTLEKSSYAAYKNIKKRAAMLHIRRSHSIFGLLFSFWCLK